MFKILFAFFSMASTLHCQETIQHFPASVWYEDGIMYLHFASNLIIVDSWHYVSEDYLEGLRNTLIPQENR